jgi:hypothetical protein
MSNVLDNDRQQQIRALGRLGWTLSRIQEATGVRRETVSGYLKAAGIAVRSRGRPSESKAKPAITEEVSTDLGAKPAITSEGVSTVRPRRTPSSQGPRNGPQFPSRGGADGSGARSIPEGCGPGKPWATRHAAALFAHTSHRWATLCPLR